MTPRDTTLFSCRAADARQHCRVPLPPMGAEGWLLPSLPRATLFTLKLADRLWEEAGFFFFFVMLRL